jgi:lysozyme
MLVRLFFLSLFSLTLAQICLQSQTNGLNVRGSPAGGVVGQLNSGSKTTLRGVDPQQHVALGGTYYDWVPVGAFNGWVASTLIKPCSSCVSTTTGLNVRSSPCGTVVTTLATGSQFTPTAGRVASCFGRTYYWVQGPQGWVASNYLQPCSSSQPLPPARLSSGCNAQSKPTTVGQKGVALIEKWEGLRTCYYLDPIGLPTICYGHLIVSGDPYHSGTCLTKQQCEDLLRSKDLPKYANCVHRLISVPLNQNQFDALVSFTFNLGCGALQNSNLRTKLNRGEYSSVCSQLKLWVHAGGKVLPGLVSRRNDECNLFNSCDGVPQLSQSVTCPEANSCDECILTQRPDLLDTYKSQGFDTSCSASNWRSMANDFCNNVEPWTCYYLSPAGTEGNDTALCPTCSYSQPSAVSPNANVEVKCLNSFGDLCAESNCALVAGNDTQCCSLTGECLMDGECDLQIKMCSSNGFLLQASLLLLLISIFLSVF